MSYQSSSQPAALRAAGGTVAVTARPGRRPDAARSLAAAFAFGMAALLLPSGAAAACQGEWDLSGDWPLRQSNGFTVYVKVGQSGSQLSGSASVTSRGKGGVFGSFGGTITENFTGSVNGDSFSFTVPWGAQSAGVYNGVIDGQGGISGTTYDKNNPQSAAGWASNHQATCRLAAATPPAPPIVLGKVKLPKVNPADAYGQVVPAPRQGEGAPGGVIAALTGADLTVRGIEGPSSLQAGLSGTFTVTIRNLGDASGSIELHIIFAGKLDQTGQIVAGAGLACEVGHDAGINAGVRCVGGRLGPGEATTVTVQGRGQAGGVGILLATLNPSRAVAESNYENNLKQFNLTIN